MSGHADIMSWPSRELRLRTISALVLGPLALLAVWAGGLVFVALIALCTVLLAAEWLGLTAQVMSVPGRVAMLAAGLPYLGCAAVALVWLRGQPDVGLRDTLFLIAVVWGSDIGAFAVGRLVGGPRMAPAISPGKTWSGAVGGLVAAIAVGLVIAAWSGDIVGAGAAVVALALAIAAQCGDLLESAIKRALGVKDSGGLIPGHGGVLDRLDGMLIAAPLAAVLAMAAGQNQVVWSLWR